MFEEIKEKAAGIINDENVKGVVEKVQEFAKTEKGKEVIDTIKEKATDFISEKFKK